MKKALICGLVCVFALTATAQAEITLSWAVTADAATAVNGTSLDKIVGTMTSDNGNINAFDLQGGITGTLYQTWPFGAVKSPDTSQNGLVGDAADSQIMFDPGNLVSVTAPVEDWVADAGTADLADGWGTYINAVCGIGAGAQATSIDFVQLYVPAMSQISYDMTASSAGGPGGWAGQAGRVPEPSMLCLLGLGSLAMMLIRRR